jgi:hypothetical protein
VVPYWEIWVLLGTNFINLHLNVNHTRVWKASVDYSSSSTNLTECVLSEFRLERGLVIAGSKNGFPCWTNHPGSLILCIGHFTFKTILFRLVTFNRWNVFDDNREYKVPTGNKVPKIDNNNALARCNTPQAVERAQSWPSTRV